MTDDRFEESTNKPTEGIPEVIRLIDIALIFTSRSRFLLLCAVAGALILGGISCLMTPVYTAQAVIISPDSMSHSSANVFLAGALGGSGLLSGITKNPSDLFIAILQGRTVIDDVMQKFHLKERYKSPRVDIARSDIAKRLKVQSDKSGLITIDYTDSDPKVAAAVANGFVDSLFNLQTRLAVNQAAQQRAFYKQQVDDEQNALQKAESDFLATQQRTGIITLTGQTESVIRSIADLKANIIRQEAELQSTRQYATDENPGVQQAEAKLDSSRSELAKLEAEQKKPSQERLRYSTGQTADAVLAYERTQREVQYHQAVLQALVKQLETAKIDAEQSAPLIQVVDQALPPPWKSGPKRAAYFLAGLPVGLLIGLAYVLWKAFLKKVEQDPLGAVKLHQVRLSLTPGKR
jgi:uncharacterized protein involved in exopolysaccharide biosynthesis